MHNILQQIIQAKQAEVEALQQQPDLSLNQREIKSFKLALAQDGLSIIGEIKRKSPSKGFLANIPEPLALVEQYLQGNVAAISVLTDEKYFAGSLTDLEQVSSRLQSSNIPVLRKDFILEPIQILESIKHGADAVLLIVAVLEEKTQDLLYYAKSLGIDAIVEVHNKAELDYAIAIGAQIIGINNRDLTTFAEDLNVCLGLIEYIPAGIHTIAESAIKSVDDIQRVQAAGFDAALIGEALVKSADVVQTLHSMGESQ